MLDRRHFTIMAGAAGLCGTAWAAPGVPFYASTGTRLQTYGLDTAAASLTPRASIVLPANVQYAWPHPTRKFLYVCASNGQPPSGPIGAAGGDPNHYTIAFKVGADGTLAEHGARRLLPVRPLHLTTDLSGRFLLIAFNIPSMLEVYRLNADGSIGGKVEQSPALDFGIYAHQVRAVPGGRTVTLCSRGNDATASRPEDPGHIEVFDFADGRLANRQTIAPGDGLGFGPRHLDFTPDGRFALVSLERQNALFVYGVNPDGTLTRDPLFQRPTLADPDGKSRHPGQGAGPIHVHPNGRFVYQTNRGSGTVEMGGRKVSNGGENDILVWRLDPATGEPALVQRAEAHGFELRTFSIDPSGTVLVAASTTPMAMPDGGTVSAGLSVYRIGADGTLGFVRKYDVDTGQGIQFWCGFLNMP